MCSTKTNECINMYKAFAQTPALQSARINADQSIISVWSQRNIEKGKTTKFMKNHVLKQDGKFCDFFPCDISDEVISTISPSEKLRAVVRDMENGKGNIQYLEIWEAGSLMQSIDLTNLDLHGKVYADGEFASFEFSPSENKLLFVAERKVDKATAINLRPKDKEGDGFRSMEYEQDWGEQLVGKVYPMLVIYDLQKDKFELLDAIPRDVSIAQPIWGSDDRSIFGMAYSNKPRKLGLIYCTNRTSSIFSLDLVNEEYKELPLPGKSVKSPRISPDGGKLVWLQRNDGGAHNDCMSLVQAKLPLAGDNTDITVIIDVVEKEVKIAEGKSFYGFYTPKLPTRCWTQDGRIAVNTNQKNTVNSYLVNLESKEITEMEYTNGSQLVLDVRGTKLLMNRRSFFQRDELVSINLNDCSVTQVVASKRLQNSENYMWEYLELEQENGDEIRDFTAIYLGPKSAESKIPLIVWPHGGPHSAYANNLFLEGCFFLSQGYGMVLINYRGSIGAGAASVKFLLGRVGRSDVDDCVLATKTVLNRYPYLDEKRVALVGGSHGGFLVTHLSGQYPDMFHAVVARNPVIDIASMSITSDIPDWCYVESGMEYTQVGEIDEDILLKMRKCSPIMHVHKVKAPTLLQIGTKDLRVPPSQGIEYHHRLRSNNIITKLNLYDDNHPLGTVPNEMDNIISTAMWLSEHLNKA
ncbi:PREDICTED: acylamino-acid-releasing enzyme-like isoform X2 [Nicrophorus vespilloides]|nr:PREDICTED: acylamino-acid-releasing enzyme-like isoform X2 [Nicrophorus vespilloides]XP_017769560.1 PREDICTED: acylamino-acid-releasing enzyme-like isoform X2 [Nicrophorus vespilloides]